MILKYICYTQLTFLSIMLTLEEILYDYFHLKCVDTSRDDGYWLDNAKFKAHDYRRFSHEVAQIFYVSMRIAKTKKLISFTFTAKLISVFVFAT